MGYRLEISRKVYADCVGKLFGYISDDKLHKCKSWHWLKDNHYFDDEPELQDVWDYGITHYAELTHDEFKEFINLYIEDYNKYSPYDYHMSLDDFKDVLTEPSFIIIEWG